MKDFTNKMDYLAVVVVLGMGAVTLLGMVLNAQFLGDYILRDSSLGNVGVLQDS